jgi:hypothetical protein
MLAVRYDIYIVWRQRVKQTRILQISGYSVLEAFQAHHEMQS